MSDNNLPAVTNYLAGLPQSMQADTAIKLDERAIAEVSTQGMKAALEEEVSVRSGVLDQILEDLRDAQTRLTKEVEAVTGRLRDRFTESVAGSMEGLVQSLAPLSQSQQSFGELEVRVCSLDLRSALADYQPKNAETGVFGFEVEIELSHLPKPGLKNSPQKSDFRVDISLSASESLTAFPELLAAHAEVQAQLEEKKGAEKSLAEVRKQLARIPDEIERRRREIQKAILQSSEMGRQLLSVVDKSEVEVKAELEKTRFRPRVK